MKFLFLFLFPTALCAQLEANWAYGYGRLLTSLSTRQVDRIYTTGYLLEPADFDPSAGTFWITTPSAFLTRYSNTGELVWAIEVPFSADSDSGQLSPVISASANGSVVIGGDFNVSAPGILYRPRLQKYTQNGQLAWSFVLYGDQNARIRQVTHTSDGGIVVGGSFRGLLDLDPDSVGVFQLNGTQSDNSFLAKYTSDGDFVWARLLLGVRHVSGLTVDHSGNIWIALTWYGTANLDPGGQNLTLMSMGSLDGVLVKCNPQGAPLQFLQFKSNDTDWPHDLAVGSQNQVVMVSHFAGTLATEPASSVAMPPPCEGLHDGLVAQVDSNCTLQWIHKIGGPSSEQAQAVLVDNEGVVYVSGSFQQTVDFNPDNPGTAVASSAGVYDPYIVRYKPDGQFLDLFTAGGPESDATRDLALAGPHLYWAGFVGTNVDFNPFSSAASIISQNPGGAGAGGLVRFDLRDSSSTSVVVPHHTGLQQLALRPNPVAGGHRLTAPATIDGQTIRRFEIHDSAGRLVRSGALGGARTDLQAPESAGAYRVLFFAESGKIVGIAALIVQ